MGGLTMFKIEIKTKADVRKIQTRFRLYLSEEQILKTTARTLNITAERVRGFAKREVKEVFTINKKYLDRMSYVSKYASGTVGGLQADVSFSFKPTPMVGFSYMRNGSRGGLTIEIKRGVQKPMRHAFVATMKSGHTGIYATGRYIGKKFVPLKERTTGGKTRITELRSSSAYSMFLNPTMQKKTVAYVSDQLPKRLTALLQQKVNKMCNS
jgi:hypothetical protein